MTIDFSTRSSSRSSTSPRSRVSSATTLPALGTVEGAGEHRQSLEEPLLGGREQVVGPLDGRPKCPVPLRAGSPAAGQEVETLVQPVQQIRGRECSVSGPPPARWPAECRRGGGRSRSTSSREAGSIEGRRERVRAFDEQLHSRPLRGRAARRRMICSPLTPSASRDVASTWTSGHPWAMAWISSAAPSMTCSQLSSTRRAERDCSAVITDWVRLRPGLSLTSRTSATARGTSLG